ncbi:hypothetical protein FACS1894217_14270 [Clostridia bacterium]|nr:hypothetical protein FACS1894217_14270 [Clostridia bacterium]
MKLAFTIQHFGRADRFKIVELNEVDFSRTYLDDRLAAPRLDDSCGEHEHLRERAAILADVDVLFAAKVGGFAYNLLSNAGIQVLEQVGEVDALLDGYVKYLQRPKFTGLRKT